jgi:hypothetical protein
MGGAVKAVTKVVSTVAKVAAPVAKVVAPIAKVVAPITPLLTVASLGFQLYSATQARKSVRQAAGYEEKRVEAATKLEESRQKQSDIEAQRRRIAAIREQRIRTGQVVAATAGAGLGLSGTSGYIGSVGALSSQAAANIGAINVGQGFAAEQSGYSVAAGQAGSRSAVATAQGAGWQQMGSLAQGFGTQFGNIFKIPETSQG